MSASYNTATQKDYYGIFLSFIKESIKFDRLSRFKKNEWKKRKVETLNINKLQCKKKTLQKSLKCYYYTQKKKRVGRDNNPSDFQNQISNEYKCISFKYIIFFSFHFSTKKKKRRPRKNTLESS